MRSTHLRLHTQKLLLIFGLLISSIIITIMVGIPKAFSDIDWLDVIGEGGSALAMGIWMVLILASRPAGRVTNLLSLGLGFMFIAMWQDAMDEFIKTPDSMIWEQGIESVAMPFGIALLTYGLFHWYSEQVAINEQLHKRERLFREHRFIDRITQLGRVDFLKEHLNTLLQASAENSLPNQNVSNHCLIIADIDRFADFNRLHGHKEGDSVLHEIAEVLLLNLRADDFICRYAGDRFAILLPETSLSDAKKIAEELQKAVQHFAYKHKTSGETLYQSISLGLVKIDKNKNYQTTIRLATETLEQAKHGNGLCLAS